MNYINHLLPYFYFAIFLRFRNEIKQNRPMEKEPGKKTLTVRHFYSYDTGNPQSVRRSEAMFHLPVHIPLSLREFSVMSCANVLSSSKRFLITKLILG